MNSPVSYEIVEGIGIIAVDHPPVNALSHSVREGLMSAITAAQSDESEAVIICCKGRTFFAGADITEFGKPIREPWLPVVIDAIENSKKLVVAAIHGTALGGGFEVALACHYRCALESAKVGLPEVKIGLLPGAGGTQRTPRLAGVEAALQMMTTGNPVPAAQALALKLIDRVVEGDLLEAARVYARELIDEGAAIRRTGGLEVAPVSHDVFDGAAALLHKKARGQTAPQRIVECVRAAMEQPLAEGIEVERKLFMECMQDPQSRALQHVFFAEREAAKVSGLRGNTTTREISKVGVIGSGTMGGGIAMSIANAGIEVTIIDIDATALERGLSVVDRNYAGSVKRGKVSEDKAAAARARIQGSTDYGDIADADLVIEAVFENLELKKTIFKTLDDTCKPGAILATNTSYQDVDEIATATSRPEDVIGLHFFSPANIMKLLEVVRADKTADDVLATCMAFAKRIRKVPVVARVCYGFIGNRMFEQYMREAQLCLIEGAAPEAIDAAMYDWGMAMGPISVADLAGLDIGYKARENLPQDERGDPKAYAVPDALVEMGRLGQKSGGGFYDYDPVTRKKKNVPIIQEVVEREAKRHGVERREISSNEIVDRLISALVGEGKQIVAEGIAQRPGDVDVVYVYGYGFPAWRGGPLHYSENR